MRKILVLRGGALGDFIVTLPALALLRARWPEARIDLIGNATAAQLVIGGPNAGRSLLDAGHSQHEARWSELFADGEGGALSGKLRAWLGEFDLVINHWPDPDGAVREKLPVRAGQIFLSANALPARAPAAAHYCEPLRELGLEAKEFWVPLERRVADGAPRPVAIHAGSGSPRKNWPIDRWRELCAWLRREHAAELLLVAGEADARVEALADLGHIARRLPLAKLATALARCALFIGHDSGVSHLAAACRVPGVLLFGPTDPAMWAPPAPHVRVIRRGAEMNAISLADVQHAVSAALRDS